MESSHQEKEELVKEIEAVLFYLGEPTSITFLTQFFSISEKEIKEAIELLKKKLEGRAVTLVESGSEAMLTTAPAHSATIERLIKEERERDLGRAGIETLAIIAYKDPLSKKEIEYIRGVNSQFALRNLLLRGLVERNESKTNNRMVLYSITPASLLHLGIGSLDELPEYTKVREELEKAMEEQNSEVEAESEIETEEHKS